MMRARVSEECVAGFSPFPPEGRRFCWRVTTGFAVRVSYGGKWPLYAWPRRFRAVHGRWPLFSFSFFGLRGYIGWKPLNFADPQFDIPPGIVVQYPVEFSVRLARG